MPNYYLVRDGRIDIKTPLDEEALRRRLEGGELNRCDLISDCKEQKRADELDFLFPKDERRIGIHGPRRSGKTSLLACWTQKGKPFEDGSLIVPVGRLRTKSFEGMNDLKDAWSDLLEGREPRATVGFRPVDLTLARDGVSWKIRTAEYGGSLLDPEEDDRRLRHWFHNSDAILFLVSADDRSFQLHELQRFLLSIQQETEKSGLPMKPVAVLLTKSDLEDESARERSDELAATLRAFRFPTDVFSVSVFGSHDPADEHRPSPGAIRPIGVVEPLLWALGEVDRLVFEAIREKSGDDGDEKADPYELLRLQNLYQNEKNRHGGGVDGMVDRRLAELADRLNPLRRRNLLQRYAGIAAILAVALALLFLLLRNEALRNDESRFQDIRSKIDRAETLEDVDRALEEYWRYGFILPKRFDAELEHLALERRHVLRFDLARRDLESALRHAVNFGETKWLYDNFLEAYTVEAYPEQAAKIREYHAALEQAIEEERRGIRFLPASAFEEKIARIDERLKAFGPNDPRRKEFVDDRDKIAKDWDLSDYRLFYETIDPIRTAEDLTRSDELAKRYLDQCDKRDKYKIESRYREDVETWTNWFEKLKTEHALTFVLKSVEIPRSFFEDPQLASKIKVTLQIGALKEQSLFLHPDAAKKENDLVFLEVDQRCSIPKALWSEKKKTTIRLTVTESWGWLGGAKAVCAVSDSPYPYLDFSPPPNGVFIFPTDKGLPVMARTELEGFSLPYLPEP